MLGLIKHSVDTKLVQIKISFKFKKFINIVDRYNKISRLDN